MDAQLALLSHNNCLITDRPDLPRAPDTGWTTNFTRELAAIDAAICALTGECFGGADSVQQSFEAMQSATAKTPVVERQPAQPVKDWRL